MYIISILCRYIHLLMNYIDIILATLLIWGLVRGFGKGLFSSLASLVALVVGLYVAVHFSDMVGSYFFPDTSEDNHTSIKLASFAITFVLVIILVTLAGKILTKIADFASLGILNKILGAVFGVLKMAFIASAILMLVDAGNRSLNFFKQETLDQSYLYEPIRKIAPIVLPKIMRKSDRENVKEYQTI